MRVVVIGAGYVGLTTGMALAHIGHKVDFIEKDPAKIQLLRSGSSPIHEPGVEELLEIDAQQLSFHDRAGEFVAEADLIMIAVGTPPKANGEAETRFVEEAVTEVVEQLKDDTAYTLVVKSTVPIGTNHKVAELIGHTLRNLNINSQVYTVSNPEFLREGRALKDALYPDRIVVGSEHPKAVDSMRRLYQPILEQTFDSPSFIPRPEGYELPPLISVDPASAEVIKYAANAFLALKISFINEIAGLCEKAGADVVEVARGIGLDPRIGSGFLGAGLGWGGSCFPKDTAALLAKARDYGYTMPIVEAARLVNQRQRQHLASRLEDVLGGVRGRTIGVLGLAFKAGTDDVRESPALEFIKLLLERGARVHAHDPVALENAKRVLGEKRVRFFQDPHTLAEGVDALVLATEWPEYRTLDLRLLGSKMRSRVLLDGRNLFHPQDVRKEGFVYIGVGR